jgi:hypothetical protein
MRLAEVKRLQSANAWSTEEEQTIAAIQQTESVLRTEAIRRMQRRKKASRSLALRLAAPTMQHRVCRNPRCARGDDGGPGSLAHLKADALYCNDACRMAGQRSPSRRNRTSDRQCLRGSKANKFGSLRSPYGSDEHAS